MYLHIRRWRYNAYVGVYVQTVYNSYFVIAKFYLHFFSTLIPCYYLLSLVADVIKRTAVNRLNKISRILFHRCMLFEREISTSFSIFWGRLKKSLIFFGNFFQIRNDYLTSEAATKIDQDMAVQLCCLEIRFFFKDMPQIALDKKSNLEYLEKEVNVFHLISPRM